MNSLNEALKQFGATEANLAKLKKLWSEIQRMIPSEISFGDSTNGNYDDRCRAFIDVQKGLPKIDGWELPLYLYDIDQIGQMRFDAQEVGEIESFLYVGRALSEQGKQLDEYTHRLKQKRRQLVRDKILATMDLVDSTLRELSSLHLDDCDGNQKASGIEWNNLKNHVSAIDILLGSTERPQRWNMLQRHLGFGEVGDFRDIRDHDWPAIKSGITNVLYSEYDPLPVQVEDLGILVRTEPSGEVVTKIKWESLDDALFERLLFSLISDSDGYENPGWLTNTNAPDRGRDLSVMRVNVDSLGGTIRQRVIIQCKHWLTKSINLQDVTYLKEQMKLWEPPRVDILIIATSGRFTSDAIQYIEKNNQSDTALCIEMWPESHLERCLASRPALIAEFNLG